MGNDSNIEIQIRRNICEINKKEWNSIVDKRHIQLKYDYLKIINSSLMNDFSYFYIMVYFKGKLVGSTCAIYDENFCFTDKLGGFSNRIASLFKLRFKVFQVISPITEFNLINLSNEHLAMHPQIIQLIIDSVHKLGEEYNVDIIIWRDYKNEISYLTKLEDKKYHHLYYMPGTYVNLKCDCFDKYVLFLNKKNRSNIRNKINKRDSSLKLEVVDINSMSNDDIEACYDCYINTYEKSKIKYDYLSMDYFMKCKEQDDFSCKMILARYKNEIIGMCHIITSSDIIINTRMGMNYKYVKKTNLYYHLLYKNIEYAVSNNFNILYLSQTTYRAKLEVGAKIAPLHSYLYIKNRLFSKIFRLVFKKEFSKYSELSTTDCPMDVLKKYEKDKFN